MSLQCILAALSTKDISATEKLVLICAANYTDPQARCYPSQRKLAEDSGLTDRTVRAALASLREKGLIEVLERRRPDGSRSTDLITLKLQAEAISGGVGKMLPGGGENASGLMNQSSNQIEKNTPRRRCPPEWEPSYEDRLAVPDLTETEVSSALAEFRDHTFGTARSDWSATFRNWLREAKRRKDRDTARQRTSGPSAKLDAKRANHERSWRAAVSLADDEPGWNPVGEDYCGRPGTTVAGLDGASIAETGGVAPSGEGGGDARDFPPLRLVSPTGTG